MQIYEFDKLSVLFEKQFHVLQSCWKLGLQNSFKNFCHGHGQGRQSDSGPPPKRRRVSYEEEITEEECDRIVKKLKVYYFTH